jgi:hypothetical protein
MKSFTDIALHTAPTIAVGIAMEFLAATALHVLAPPLAQANLVLAGAAALAFSWIWGPRERAQHGGALGGAQSRLEAYVPLLAGPIAFVASAFAFWIWPV